MNNKKKEGQFEAIRFLLLGMALTQFNYGPYDGVQGEFFFLKISVSAIALPYSFFYPLFAPLPPKDEQLIRFQIQVASSYKYP